jgi:hypothetical protein
MLPQTGSGNPDSRAHSNCEPDPQAGGQSPGRNIGGIASFFFVKGSRYCSLGERHEQDPGHHGYQSNIDVCLRRKWARERRGVRYGASAIRDNRVRMSFWSETIRTVRVSALPRACSMRQYRMLRQLTIAARERACRRIRPSHRAFFRTRRRIDLGLRHQPANSGAGARTAGPSSAISDSAEGGTTSRRPQHNPGSLCRSAWLLCRCGLVRSSCTSHLVLRWNVI